MDERSNKILQSACKKFEQYGIRSVSIDDICKNVRISKKTFYQIYPKKEDLIEAVLDYTSSALHDEFENLNEDRNAVDALVAIIKAVKKYSKESTGSFQYDLEKYYPEIFENFQEKKMDRMRNSFEVNIKQGIAEGYYREDLDVELVSIFHSIQLRNFHREIRDYVPEIAIKRLNDFYIDVVVRLIANEKGLQYIEENIKEH